MRDVNASLLPDETVQYQYAYPLWLKALAGAAVLVVIWMLYDDIRAARYFFVIMEAGIGIYAGTWLVQLLRDSAQYVVTDRRVMRLGGAADLEIAHADISEVRLMKDTFSGSGYVRVKAADKREIRIPLPNLARSKGENLADLINQYRPPRLEEPAE